jgi:hypothetical protein
MQAAKCGLVRHRPPEAAIMVRGNFAAGSVREESAASARSSHSLTAARHGRP